MGGELFSWVVIIGGTVLMIVVMGVIAVIGDGIDEKRDRAIETDLRSRGWTPAPRTALPAVEAMRRATGLRMDGDPYSRSTMARGAWRTFRYYVEYDGTVEDSNEVTGGFVMLSTPLETAYRGEAWVTPGQFGTRAHGMDPAVIDTVKSYGRPYVNVLITNGTLFVWTRPSGRTGNYLDATIEPRLMDAGERVRAMLT